MQQLLTGHTRLPGFHGEWETKTLFELADRKKQLGSSVLKCEAWDFSVFCRSRSFC